MAIVRQRRPETNFCGKIANASCTAFTIRFKRWLLEKAHGKCEYCGVGLPEVSRMEVDHVVPKSKGGPTDIENLRASCSTCNSAKRDGDLERLRDSIRLRRSKLFGVISVKQMNLIEEMGIDLGIENSIVFHFEGRVNEHN